MSDNEKIFIYLLFVVVLLTGGVYSVRSAYVECSDQGGDLVRGIVWYKCINN